MTAISAEGENAGLCIAGWPIGTLSRSSNSAKSMKFFWETLKNLNLKIIYCQYGAERLPAVQVYLLFSEVEAHKVRENYESNIFY